MGASSSPRDTVARLLQTPARLLLRLSRVWLGEPASSVHPPAGGELRLARDAGELARAFRALVREELGPAVGGTLLVADASSGELVDPLGALEPFADAAALLAASADLPGSMTAAQAIRLTPGCAAGHDWLARHRLRALAPLWRRDGTLAGLLATWSPGGAPDAAELRWLSLVGQLAAVVLEGAATPAAAEPGAAAGAEPPARECRRCDRVLAAEHALCPRCDRPTEEAEVPYVLARRFRMVRRLGSGGLGVVYQAVDLALDRPVALKTVATAAPETAASLRREGRARGALDHPNLAAVHDLQVWRGRPILVVELLAGGTLEHRLERGAPLPVEEVARIGRAVAAALEHLHARGLVHGDVKPSNVGFAADGTPKLLDFGLTRVAPGQARTPVAARGAVERGTSAVGSPPAEREELLRGTLNYLSPDALAGRPADPGDDVWALGVVLWEAASGRRLFWGGERRAVVRQIRRGRVPALPAAPGNEAVVATAVAAALRRERAARPAHGGELLALLRGGAAAGRREGGEPGEPS